MKTMNLLDKIVGVIFNSNFEDRMSLDYVQMENIKFEMLAKIN